MVNPYTVTVECDGGNEYDGRLGLRISSIFVIGFGSMMGAVLPIIAARSKRFNVPATAFFIAKYFGSGVIIATAFIHLLAPASDALASPCVSGVWAEYDWAEGIALMMIFVMFFIELMAARYDILGDHSHDDVESADPAADLVRRNQASTKSEEYKGASVDEGLQHAHPSRAASQDISYPASGNEHLAHQRDHDEDGDTDLDYFAAQMTAIFILEFGVIFHSIFIGLTLAVAGSEFDVLYIVLVFHQTFEGLGLGSRLATADWPKSKEYLPYVLGVAYGLTTPIAIAIGLGVSNALEPGGGTMSLVNGVFDAISAGILIYTGLVELMAHEFMFNPTMRKSSIRVTLAALGCMVLGAGLMALLGKWA